jgi:transcriptional regulator GlxA family with amidase domain
MILAASGLLNGHEATTRRFAVGVEQRTPLSRLAEVHPSIRTVEAAVVDGGPVVTGGGVTLAIDTTLHLIGRICGPEAAAEVALAIEYTAYLDSVRPLRPAVRSR